MVTKHIENVPEREYHYYPEDENWAQVDFVKQGYTKERGITPCLRMSLFDADRNHWRGEYFVPLTDLLEMITEVYGAVHPPHRTTEKE